MSLRNDIMGEAVHGPNFKSLCLYLFTGIQNENG